MNRAEHLQWCKDRALEYVKTGDFNNAVASMLSDLSKHEETKASSGGICAQLGMLELMNSPSKESIAKFINGFN